MSEKYIRQNKSSFNIVKNSRIYAKINDLEDAVFVRDLLIANDWNLDKIPKSIKKGEDYLVLAVIDEKIHLLAKCKSEVDEVRIKRLTKRFIRNPNNSRYGLNITKVFDTFVIKKQIAGDEYIFGYYDRLDDAQFVRNFLLDNQWNVNEFKEVEFDDETNTYKVICVIDEHVYVIDSYAGEKDIDLEKSYEKFLARVSKHKYGLAHHPHLDLLKDRISDLESRFNVRTRDDTWRLNDLGENASPLNEIIFSLTPFQQSVYDAIDEDTSLEKIELSLIRYKSKNFTKKISKNIDELIKLNLIKKTGDNTYSKTNF